MRHPSDVPGHPLPRRPARKGGRRLNTLRADMADHQVSIRKAAPQIGYSKSALARQLAKSEPDPEVKRAIVGLIADPTVAWRNCPDWTGWPAYPEGADTHPAACLLDAGHSTRAWLAVIDGQQNPSAWTAEQKRLVRELGKAEITNARRLLDSIAG